jgi:prepilin-type N-terminal cleavage/methylation domain-containing protein
MWIRSRVESGCSVMIERQTQKPSTQSAGNQHGFTLLEVMIALTITSMVLGSLFALAAGSKQLAVRTQSSLHDTIQARAHINFALLDNEFRSLEPALDNSRFRLQPIGVLPDVLRRTSPMNDLLQAWQLIDQNTGETIDGVRWVRVDLPQ